MSWGLIHILYDRHVKADLPFASFAISPKLDKDPVESWRIFYRQAKELDRLLPRAERMPAAEYRMGGFDEGGGGGA